eukprot:SAG31_NODE_5136_length_2720_cov_4.331553_1_plen_147_part_00
MSRQQGKAAMEPLSAQSQASSPAAATQISRNQQVGGGPAPPGHPLASRGMPSTAQSRQSVPPPAGHLGMATSQQMGEIRPMVPAHSVAGQAVSHAGGEALTGAQTAEGEAAKSALEAMHLQREVDTEILIEKEQTIQELRETVEVC